MKDEISDTSRARLRAYLGIAGCIAGFFAIGLIGSELYFGFRMRFRMPDERMVSHGELAFLYYGLILGIPSIFLGIWGLRSAEFAWPGPVTRIRGWFSRITPARRPTSAFLSGLGLAAAGIAAIRLFVFHQRVVTNDEFYYQFDAKLLKSHRLYLSISPALGQFFPRFQAVFWNGRYFSKYFIGQAAVLAFGSWAGIGAWIVPLLSVLAVLAFGAFVSGTFGRREAAVTVLFIAISPFYVLTGATSLSQPSVIFFFSIFLLAWNSYRQSSVARNRIGLCFAMGVLAAAMGLIRPVSAAGLLAPLLIAEMIAQRKRRRGVLAAEALAFGVPAIAGIAILFAVNSVQNGEPLRTAYALQGFPLDRLMTFRQPEDWSRFVENMAITFGRLNWSQFGWPLSLAFVPFAFRSSTARVLGGSALGFFIANHLTPSPGIDPVGPEHFAELAPLLALFTALGVIRLVDSSGNSARTVPWLVGLLVIFETTIFLPHRLRNLESYVRQANRVSILSERAGLHHAVVFAGRSPFPWLSAAPDVHGRRAYAWPIRPGESGPADDVLRLRRMDNGSGFGEYGDDNLPVPDPDLKNDVLFLLDFGPADAVAIDRLPGRSAYVLAFSPPDRLEIHALTRVEGGVVVEPQIVALTSATDPDRIRP